MFLHDCLGTITFVTIPSEYKSLVKVLVTVYYPCSQINDTQHLLSLEYTVVPNL